MVEREKALRRIEKLRDGPAENGAGYSNHLLRLVVDLAEAAHGGGACAFVELVEPGGDLGVFGLEQAQAVEIAFDDERAE